MTFSNLGGLRRRLHRRRRCPRSCVMLSGHRTRPQTGAKECTVYRPAAARRSTLERETILFDVAEHVAVLRRHGVEVDLVLFDPSAGMPVGLPGVELIERRLAGPNGMVHDPARLADALEDLLDSHRGRAPRGTRSPDRAGSASHTKSHGRSACRTRRGCRRRCCP